VTTEETHVGGKGVVFVVGIVMKSEGKNRYSEEG